MNVRGNMNDHESVIIEVAINGSTKPERNPHVPLTPEAIRVDANRCLDAGASVGAIVGKALGALASGKGRVPVLVTLR